MRSRLRNKLIAFILAATILPIATSILVSHFYTQSKLEDKAIRDNLNLIHQGKLNLDTYLQSVEQNMKLLYHNTVMMEILENRTDNFFSESRLFLTEQEVLRSMQTLKYASQDVRQVYLYVEQARKSYLLSENRLVRTDQGAAPFKPDIRREESRITPPHPMSAYGKQFFIYSSGDVFTYQTALTNIVDNIPLGSLSLDFSPDTIKAICDELYTKGSEELYIIGPSGEIMYQAHPDPQGSKKPVPWLQELNQSAARAERGYFRSEDASYNGIHIYETIHAPGGSWLLVKGVPDSVLYKSQRELTGIWTLVGVIFLGLATVVTIYVSLRMTAPISALIGYMNKIESGNMNVDIRVKADDELGILARRFRSMMHTINELILREYKLEVANKTNELKALQAQINPHFINNALQSIAARSLQKGDREVYSLISSLGKMMRYSMKTEETIVPLKSEWDYAKSYNKLQKQRFRDQFEAEMELEPGLESILVPKMVIQPLVENYFKHGFDGSRSDNIVRIVCRSTGDRSLLHIEVSDNGFGIGEDELTALRADLEACMAEMGEPGSHIGLANVLSRLKLYYREQTTMEIDRGKDGGFRVLLTIPIMQEEGEPE
ncbi:putative two-component sensor kinase [Paenibacillus chitinolyticus]|uniref:cache domain-containing sensor histidine kinase n=1 Tax=Paenibacillus chitinolyticus TaxID=79263 RepID=UPI0026E4F6E6|nr:histidine kinase [Paenibacillus chitinolyticus]GKS09134.1 putative two-component sensor kinase [Paenibacillus chitinolyticus]